MTSPGKNRFNPLSVFSTVVLACVSAMSFSCEPNPASVVENFRLPPLLTSLIIGTTVINTDTMNIGSVRSPDDILTIRTPAVVRASHSAGPTAIGEVRYRVLSPDWRDNGATGTLRDDGSGVDQTAGDSLYSVLVNFSIQRPEIGDFFIEVTATGDGIVQSASVSASLLIIRANKPPMVSNLVADSSVSLSGQSQLIQLSISASDPDGALDIQRVLFDSFQPPSGAPSSKNPFLMYDDGNEFGPSGDAVAKDGTYSLRVLFEGATVGTYRFLFRAVDRSLDSSNVITHILTVTP